MDNILDLKCGFAYTKAMQIGIAKRQFNKNLKEVMLQKGVSNAQIADCVGRKSVSWVSQVINFKTMPSEEEMMKISILLETPEEVIFPPEYQDIYNRLKGVANEISVNITPQMLYSEPSLLLDDNIENTLSNKQTIELALSVLKERERDLLCIRHGLNGESPHTLEECGKRLGVTRERIRQMEAKAHEKIRQSQYIDILPEIVL